MRLRNALLGLVPLLGLALYHCGSDSTSSPSLGGDYPFPRNDAGAASDVGSPDDTGLPPEMEERRAFELPQAGGRYVYVANPRRDTVAVIDSRSLAIQSVEAGDGPTFLATVPGRDEAIVVNVHTNTASILRTGTDGRTSTSSVPIVAGANAISIAPDGRHAVVWLDTSRPNTGVPAGSFQDVSLLTLDPAGDRAVQLSVGFRPIDVVFDAMGEAAYVVTEDGLSILRFADLTGPAIIPNVSLSDDRVSTVTDAGTDDASVDGGVLIPPSRDARPSDVSVTPDGRYAIARIEGSSALRLVNLSRREVRTLDAGGVVTDLDVSPDGSFALAVIRDRGRVLRIPLPAAFDDPTAVTSTELVGELFGSVAIASDGGRALLWTTASDVERLILLDLTGSTSPAVLRLRKTVRAVAFAPDGRTALVIHGRAAGNPNEPNIDLETRIDRAWGYTLVDVPTRFAKLQLTPADPGSTALTPDGDFAFVTLRDDTAGVSLVQRVSMRSFVVSDTQLGSPPLAVGVVPGTMRAFVGQEHPEGRITFIDWGTGALQSVTGFELNSRIVD